MNLTGPLAFIAPDEMSNLPLTYHAIHLQISRLQVVAEYKADFIDTSTTVSIC